MTVGKGHLFRIAIAAFVPAFLGLGSGGYALAQSTASTSLVDDCVRELSSLPGPSVAAEIRAACAEAKKIDGCQSTKGEPIFHFDQPGTDPKAGKKILAISLIHGDEFPSGSVTRSWLTRLDKIEPRNSWRVIPIANPDGLKARTRYNANKIDINRNFPSNDWNEKAISYWTTKTKKDPRRNPGPTGGSEIETRCLMKHIDEYQPDFIISVHTPFGVLDFDGPPIGNPGFRPLPWISLGNFPGSLGRYMWVDRKVPVLTIELKGNAGLKRLEEFDQLQDISGTVAIQAARVLEKNKAKE